MYIMHYRDRLYSKCYQDDIKYTLLQSILYLLQSGLNCACCRMVQGEQVCFLLKSVVCKRTPIKQKDPAGDLKTDVIQPPPKIYTGCTKRCSRSRLGDNNFF